MKYNIEGIINLRNAIVESVAKDYLREKAYIKRHPDNVSHIMELEMLTRWFKSSHFDDLATGYSGDYFIKKLDEMADSNQKPIRFRVGKEHKKDE